jgi:hypothetical protein
MGKRSRRSCLHEGSYSTSQESITSSQVSPLCLLTTLH